MISAFLLLLGIACLCLMCYWFGCNKAYDKGYYDGHEEATRMMTKYIERLSNNGD